MESYYFCIFFGDYLVNDELRLKFADEFLRKDAVAELNPARRHHLNN